MLKSQLLIILSLLFIGCSEDGLFCPDDVKLGHFKLQENTTTNFPYTKDEDLIFEDQDGKEHIFKYDSYEGPVLKKSIVEVLCSSEPFVFAAEYYDYEYRSIHFKNPNNNDLLSFSLGVETSDEDNFDERIIYDVLSIRVVIDTLGGQLLTKMVTAFHQDEELAEDSYIMQHSPKPIGDTIINFVNHTNVFRYESNHGISMLYNNKKGVLMIYGENNNYLRLKN